MGESNTVRSLYTMYMHLQQYCAHPSIYISTTFMQHSKQFFKKFGEGGGEEKRKKIVYLKQLSFLAPLVIGQRAYVMACLSVFNSFF